MSDGWVSILMGWVESENCSCSSRTLVETSQPSSSAYCPSEEGGGREGGRGKERGRERGRDGGMEGGWERGMEGGWERGREGGREGN